MLNVNPILLLGFAVLMTLLQEITIIAVFIAADFKIMKHLFNNKSDLPGDGIRGHSQKAIFADIFQVMVFLVIVQVVVKG